MDGTASIIMQFLFLDLAYALDNFLCLKFLERKSGFLPTINVRLYFGFSRDRGVKMTLKFHVTVVIQSALFTNARLIKPSYLHAPLPQNLCSQ